MATLLAGLAGGVLFLGIAITLQLLKRRRSRARLSNLELRPNCLLTRYPIVFVSGERSLFRLFDHWNDVPAFLREHGYEVLILEPSPGTARVPSILSAIENLEGKCHVVADASLESDLEAIAANRSPHISSLTLVRNEKARSSGIGKNQKFRPADLRPMDLPIEVFDVSDCVLTQKPTAYWRNATSTALLRAHNWLALGRRRAVDAMETADPRLFGSWVLESRFLDLAISLAERDAQWCD